MHSLFIYFCSPALYICTELFTGFSIYVERVKNKLSNLQLHLKARNTCSKFGVLDTVQWALAFANRCWIFQLCSSMDTDFFFGRKLFCDQRDTLDAVESAANVEETSNIGIVMPESAEDMDAEESDDNNTYAFTVNDVSGQCRLAKPVTIFRQNDFIEIARLCI